MGEYSIAFKHNQEDFYMFKRKYWHEFHIKPDDRNFENCIGLEISGVDHFIVAKGNNLLMYNDSTY